MDATENLPPGDPKLVQNIVNHLKSKGIFDQFRRDCLADVDTRPAYQNLRQRVDGYVSKFLAQQTWPPELNKNQLRESLRRQINESGMLAMGVDHLVEQVVNPKVYQVFYPHIESLVKSFLGVESPSEQQSSGQQSSTPQKQEQTAKAHSSATQEPNKSSGYSKPGLLPLPFPPPPPPPPPPPGAEDDMVTMSADNTSSEPPPPGESEDDSAPEPSMKDAKVKQEPETIEKGNPLSEEASNKAAVSEVNPKAEAQEASDSTDSSSEQKKEIVKEKMEIQEQPKVEAVPADESSSSTDTKQTESSHAAEKKTIAVKPVLDSDEADSMDSTSGSLTGRLVIDMKDYEREGTPSESNSRDSFKFSSKDSTKVKEKATEPLKFSDSSRSCDSASTSKTEASDKETAAEKESASAGGDAERAKSEEHSHHSSSGERSKESSKMKSRSSSSSDGSRSKSHGQVKPRSDKSPSKSAGDGKKHSSKDSKGTETKSKAHESKKPMPADDRHKKKDKPAASSEQNTKKRPLSETRSKQDQDSSKSKVPKLQKSKSSELPPSKGTKRKLSEGSSESRSKVHASSRGGDESKHEKSSKDSESNPSDASDKNKLGKTGSKRKGAEGSETSSDEAEKDSGKKCPDFKAAEKSVEKRENSDSEEDQNHGTKGSLNKSSGSSQAVETSSQEGQSGQVEKEKSHKSGEKEGDEKKHADKMNSASNKSSSSQPKSAAASCEDDNDDDDDDDAKSVMSDVTVSSVHTSDLSSYDDEISLSSEDELKVALEKPTKKLSLREVKEIAKVYDNIRKKSCENNDNEEASDGKTVKHEGDDTPLEVPKTPEAHSSSSTSTTPNKTSTEETSSPDFKSETKMSLRRQRKINPRYASKEFSSIFSKMKRIRSSTDNGDEFEPLQNDQSAKTPSANGRQMRRKRSSYGNGDNNVPQENGFHSGDPGSNNTIPPETPVIPNGVVENADVEKNGSENAGGTEVQVSGRKRTRSEEKIPEEKLEKPTRQARLRSSSDHKSDTHSSQRYDSADLYKPRPVIGSKSRRSRGPAQSPSTGTTDESVPPTTNKETPSISEDSNSLDSLESSHSRSGRKRGNSFSKQADAAAAVNRRKK